MGAICGCAGITSLACPGVRPEHMPPTATWPMTLPARLPSLALSTPSSMPPPIPLPGADPRPLMRQCRWNPPCPCPCRPLGRALPADLLLLGALRPERSARVARSASPRYAARQRLCPHQTRGRGLDGRLSRRPGHPAASRRLWRRRHGAVPAHRPRGPPEAFAALSARDPGTGRPRLHRYPGETGCPRGRGGAQGIFHLIDPAPVEIEAFITKVLAGLGLPGPAVTIRPDLARKVAGGSRRTRGGGGGGSFR